MNEYKIVITSGKNSIWIRIKKWIGMLSRQYEEKSEKRYVESMVSNKIKSNYSKF